jgi:hypothetical protein
MGMTITNGSRLALAVAFSGWLAPGLAPAQPLEEQIVGAWRLVSIYNESQGVKRHLLGETPIGLMVFDRAGNVSQFLSRADLPRFALPNRMQGTDQENREVVRGMIAGFGTYRVEGDMVTITWIGSSFPNRIGSGEKRIYRIGANEMTAVNPTASVGGTSNARYARVTAANPLR